MVSIEGSLILPKINIMVLQASVVEESCAFSALDQVEIPIHPSIYPSIYLINLMC